MKFKLVPTSRSPRLAALAALPLAAVLGLSACAPSSAPQAAAASPSIGLPDSDYSLDKLVAAAKAEGPITVSDTTGKIVDIAKAFSAEYGIQATGVKLTGQQQVDLITREAQAKAVKTDVLLMTDSQVVTGSLIPKGIATSWMPPDLAEDVPDEYQSPLMVTQEPLLLAYNTQKYGDTCPLNTIWDLTDPTWSGKVALPDPLGYNYYGYWWNQLATHEDDKVRSTYESYAGSPLQTTEASATAEWVKRLAANKPQLTKDDDSAAAAVGAPDQAEPFVGLMSAAKFRENKEKGYKLGICSTLQPYAGFAYTKAGVIASGTQHPNAAKLFIHYMLTEDGIKLQTQDGKKSTNTTVLAPADEPSGVSKVWDKVLVFSSSSMGDDLAQAQDWNDFWTANNR